MKKKVLLVLLLLVGVGIGTYRLTQALFSDTEVSQDNTFTAGTLDLSVDGNNGTAFDSITVENLGADGTIDGSKTWTINNSGSLPGTLSFSLRDLNNLENGCNEPEAIVDTTCANPGLGEGELGNAISAILTLDRNDGQGASTIVTNNLATANVGLFASQWDANAGTIEIPANGSVKVTMNWATDPQDYGNEIQSDQLSYVVQFDLEQVTTTP